MCLRGHKKKKSIHHGRVLRQPTKAPHTGMVDVASDIINIMKRRFQSNKQQGHPICYLVRALGAFLNPVWKILGYFFWRFYCERGPALHRTIIFTLMLISILPFTMPGSTLSKYHNEDVEWKSKSDRRAFGFRDGHFWSILHLFGIYSITAWETGILFLSIPTQKFKLNRMI